MKMMTASAISRGRTLDPKTALFAAGQKNKHIHSLIDKRNNGTATIKELRELKWKWGVKPGGEEE